MNTPGAERIPISLQFPRLTSRVVSTWLVRRDASGMTVEGWRIALARLVSDLLSVWLVQVDQERAANNLPGLSGMRLQDVPDALPPSPHTLCAALSWLVQKWLLIADKLADGTPTQQERAQLLRWLLDLSPAQALERRELVAELSWHFLEAESDVVLPELSTQIAQPLRNHLDSLGLVDPGQQIAMIACGRLSALPLHAATVRIAPGGAEAADSLGAPGAGNTSSESDSTESLRDDNSKGLPFQETCEFSYQASARMLATSRRLAESLPADGPFFTIGDPSRTGHVTLKRARREAEEIAQMARNAGRKSSRQLAREEATLANVLDLLRAIRNDYRGAWIDMATHGYADPTNARDAFMLLTGGKRLTLTMLQRERLLVGVRCFNASGCMTNLGDLDVAPDELSSFSAGVLQSGAASAVATQWSVSDTGTHLFMLRFAQMVLQHPARSPVWALRQAAQWLRTATYQQLVELQGDAHKGIFHLRPEGQDRGNHAFIDEEVELEPDVLVGVTRDAIREGTTSSSQSPVVDAEQCISWCSGISG